MLGSAYCFYKDEHLALDLVKDRVKGGVRVALLVFIEAAILFFVCYVFVFGWNEAGAECNEPVIRYAHSL